MGEYFINGYWPRMHAIEAVLLYQHNLGDWDFSQLYLSVCLVCMCPSFTAHISVTMGRILMTPGRKIET